MALLEIYKKDQGKIVRWSTVIVAGLIVAAGMYWLGVKILGTISDLHIGSFSVNALYIKSLVVVLFGVAGAAIAILVVNRPKTAEFMIATESEMRKVIWPSRREVWISTKVVIFLTLFFAILLALVDYGFIQLFKAINILA